MQTVARVILVLALAWSIAACVAPGSPSPPDSAPDTPATGLPTIPAPGSSLTPDQPKPSIEVPPPIY
jgi:hypothetical protein